MKLNIRLANSQDSFSIWQIRNQPQVRNNSLTSEEIKLENHLVWYEVYLKKPYNKLFVLEHQYKNNILGYCRYDYHETFYLVSIAIDFHHQRQGYGSILLSKTIKKMRKYHLLIKADVKKNNLASKKLFERAHFAFDPNIEKEILHYIYREAKK